MEDAGGGKRQRIESGDSGLSGIEDDDQPPELLPGQIQAGFQPPELPPGQIQAGLQPPELLPGQNQAGFQPHLHQHSPPGQSQAGPQPPEAVEEEETEPHYQGRDRIFWIKVDNEEFNSLSVARKQHNLKRRLDIMGRVRHLEYQSHNNYRAVFCGKEKVSIEAAGSDLSMMELSDSIPANYIPNYEVDRNGFYTVSGRFPEDVSNEERAKFASDMKNIGAFGFTSNESVFTLHYVTSRSAEEAVSLSLAQYSNFNLKLEKEEREE